MSAPADRSRRPGRSEPSRRSGLPAEEARRRYVAIGELAALQQIRRDAAALDARAIAVGPFARLDANAVAALDGKTRGVITNLFGTQAAFQVETMERTLSAGEWIDRLAHPAPQAFPTVEEWVDALLAEEGARGPHHGAEPTTTYGFLWALWLSTVPYGVWSEQVSGPSMDEHVLWIGVLERAITGALEHFGLALRGGTSPLELAGAYASLIEGSWLNQCLTAADPLDPDAPVSAALQRAGRLLWRGAVAGGS